jgi:hypothetical protein
MKDYRAVVPICLHQESDPLAFTCTMMPSSLTLIEYKLQTEGGIKFALLLEAEFGKPAQSGDE